MYIICVHCTFYTVCCESICVMYMYMYMHLLGFVHSSRVEGLRTKPSVGQLSC